MSLYTKDWKPSEFKLKERYWATLPGHEDDPRVIRVESVGKLTTGEHGLVIDELGYSYTFESMKSLGVELGPRIDLPRRFSPDEFCPKCGAFLEDAICPACAKPGTRPGTPTQEIRIPPDMQPDVDDVNRWMAHPNRRYVAGMTNLGGAVHVVDLPPRRHFVLVVNPIPAPQPDIEVEGEVEVDG